MVLKALSPLLVPALRLIALPWRQLALRTPSPLVTPKRHCPGYSHLGKNPGQADEPARCPEPRLHLGPHRGKGGVHLQGSGAGARSPSGAGAVGKGN